MLCRRGSSNDLLRTSLARLATLTHSPQLVYKVESILTAIRHGFSVLWTDTDVIWMRNPIPFLQRVRGGMACRVVARGGALMAGCVAAHRAVAVS